MTELFPVDEEDDFTGRMIKEEEIYDNVSDHEKRRPIIVGEQLDIEAYAALYTGRTKIKRLCFIADNCGFPSMQLEALKMAYDACKKGRDTQLFKDVVAKIEGRLGPPYGPDDEWVDEVDRRAELREERLKNNLEEYKASLIKESVRMAYNELGDFYYARGHLAEALTNYAHKKDYSTTADHIVDMCLSVTLVSIEMDMFYSIPSYARKGLSQDALDVITIAKLRCAAGLAYLVGRDYKLAASKFLRASPDIGNSYSEVIAPRDIATYGGLCALASFDREILKSLVIDNKDFQKFLELVPEVRELINNFYASRFDSCLGYLAVLKPTLLLDIHLHDHLDDLFSRIRNKALIQYTLPFSTIYLHKMAKAFGTTVMDLEKELRHLITTNQIKACIDSHDKILHAKHEDQRNSTFKQALRTGKELEKEMKRMILMKSIMEYNYYL